MKGVHWLCVVFVLVLVPLSSAVVINEFTVDPQTDWDNSGGNPTSSDEWFELFNDGNTSVDLTNWTVFMDDGTNATELLSGTLAQGGYRVVLNFAGTLNNDGRIQLYNDAGQLVDSVSYGDWDDGNIPDNALNGNADDFTNECLARIPNGVDSGVDKDDFQKVECTFNAENRVILPNEQGLNVVISGLVKFKVLPRTLDFGVLQPGTVGNPAVNGPIVFDVNGSSVDVMVEVANVTGYPFESGLKINGLAALGQLWTIAFNSPIQTANATLDVPSDAEPNTVGRGTIVYTVAGAP